MTGVNPQGCRVVSFKTPTHLESRHDFLWREVAELPERGAIGVFNRSYYEAVLITRVHPELLAAEGLETSSGKLDALFEERYHSIRALERHLTANGTRIVKIFLHISKDEQRRRLLQRLDSAEKAWKASRSDVEERKFWKDYQRAYEIALSETSRAASPWHVVPADDKPNARLFVSRIIIDALEALPLDMPPPDDARKRELGEIRAALEGS
jgi:PPK2 family polyphosphate:nucleotide phosphotransferase